ncbi:MAG: hypothetical protein V3W41_15375 [Planctomycetota bacterium]
MKFSRLVGLAMIVVCCVFVSAASAQVNPDVIVGDLPNISNYASVGGIDAISVGTTSCNIGTTDLSWISNTPAHPVIGQNLYRLDNGRFEQIGQSWLKHGFLALSGNLCDTCTGSGGSVLNPGCSDPYGSGLNGSQGGLGPKFEVNATTGVFNYPFSNPAGSTGNSIFKRLQFAEIDIVAGALYFVEGHYVTADDAFASNQNNNASYRPIAFAGSVGSGFNGSLTGATVREQSAIFAWETNDPSVTTEIIDIPNDGRVIVAYKSTSLGGGISEYEYAVYNMNSHASIQSVAIQVSSSATVTSIDFHDVFYHSGETQIGTDWVGSHAGGMVTWASETLAQNTNANAIRWANLFNFRFQSDLPAGDITLGLFRPGAGVPTSVTIVATVPEFSIAFTNGVPSEVPANFPTEIDIAVSPITGSPDPATAFLFASVDGGAFAQTPLTDLGNDNYRATLPAVACFSTINWYVTINSVSGLSTITGPADAPIAGTFETIAGVVALAASDFETSDGWTVVNDASLTDGAWDRALPLGGGDRGDPALDSDGSGSCWVTDHFDGNTDVDNGATRLLSPAFDLRGLDDPQFAFDFWYDNDFGVQDDTFTIEISNNNGVTWTLVEATTTSTDVWNARRIAVLDYVSLSSVVRLRFTAEDEASSAASVVEAGLDNFRLLECRLLDEAAARGNVNENAGSVVDVLLVNSSTGGPLRRVDSGFGAVFTITMLPPPANAGFTDWIIVGQGGIPLPSDQFDLSALGQLAVFPCLANPTDPRLFVLADNLLGSVSCAPLLPATGAPWFFILPEGIPGPIQFTLQGLIRDDSDPQTLSVTNAVIYRTLPGL